MNLMKRAAAVGGRWLAHYLSQPVHGYQPFAVNEPASLAAMLKPGDVLLVEGNHRISTAIKYLTQSTWSHAALYVGDVQHSGQSPDEAPVLIEADLERGVILAPLNKYAQLNTRICRPVGLTPEDLQRLLDYVVARIGHAYDVKNIIDLARYLLPTPPVPVSWRRRMLALGSGDPTRAICSTLIAQAFQSVRYPILPHIERPASPSDGRLDYTIKELLHIRHYSLFAPRDFDISPYFSVIKPALERDFDYRNLVWADEDQGQAPSRPL